MLRMACRIVFAGILVVLLPACSQSGRQSRESNGESLEPEQQLANAARSGDLDTLKAIIEQDPGLLDQRDAEGRTPFHYAALGSQVDVAKFLLENGADPNVQDSDGQTVLDLADEWRASKEFKQVLVEAGAQ